MEQSPTEAVQQDIAAILTALGLSDHARPYSPHQVVQRDILPAIAALTQQPAARYVPPYLADLVAAIEYKPDWTFSLVRETNSDGSGGLQLRIVSQTPDSFNFGQTVRVRHAFLVPAASYNRDTWAAWIFDRVRDVETHEAGEFFRISGVREFAPHHSNGEDPYRVWHVSDWATADKSSGTD